ENLNLKNELKNSNKLDLKHEIINNIAVCIMQIQNKDLKNLVDEFKNKFDKCVILLLQEKDFKVQIVAGVKNAPIKAGALVKEIATILDGNGGGRDDFATAGGKNINKINEALEYAQKIINERLN
ncbi:DHHA1 domain-containing protein, partial [Campylobacter volucris]